MLKLTIALPVLASILAFGQSAPGKLAFESASVKPSNPAAGPFARTMGGPGTKDPGRIRYSNLSLKSLLLTAYGVNDFQIAGPGWMEAEHFGIDATMLPGTTQEQFREMLRNLLADRFRIVLHREKKDAPAYRLVVGRNGPNMTESAPVASPPDGGPPTGPASPQQIERDREGFPKIPPGGPPQMLQFVVLNRGRLQGRMQTMNDLAGRLTYLLGHPVTDETALTGKYDFSLTFAAEGTALGGRPGPPLPPSPPGGDTPSVAEAETPQDLVTAVQSQLGLRLEATKAPMEIIMIDRIEKTPVAN